MKSLNLNKIFELSSGVPAATLCINFDNKIAVLLTSDVFSIDLLAFAPSSNRKVKLGTFRAVQKLRSQNWGNVKL